MSRSLAVLLALLLTASVSAGGIGSWFGGEPASPSEAAAPDPAEGLRTTKSPSWDLPEARGRSRTLQDVVEEGVRLVRRSPTRNRHWQTLPLESQAHPEIVRYRIRWFSGKWSKWFFPGDGDVDWKLTTRRVWCYFDDHEHELAVPASP